MGASPNPNLSSTSALKLLPSCTHTCYCNDKGNEFTTNINTNLNIPPIQIHPNPSLINPIVEIKSTQPFLINLHDESKCPGIILPSTDILPYNQQVEKLCKSLGKFNKYSKDSKDCKYFNQHLKEYIIKYDNDTLYTGTLNPQWQREGFGILFFDNGRKYEGFFNEDLFNGRGRLINADMSYYEGNFINGKANGFGTYHDCNGRVYIGNFVDEMMDGHGEEIFPKGNRYEGHYVQNMKKGKGVLYLIDGSKYEGNFDRNMINGIGVFKWNDGRKYEGEWVDGKMNGVGCFDWTDNKKYVGYYEMDRKCGFGVFIWPPPFVRVYEGFWKNGVQCGYGRMIRLNKAQGKDKNKAKDKEKNNDNDDSVVIVYGKYENGANIRKMLLECDKTRIAGIIDEEKQMMLIKIKETGIRINYCI